MKKLDTLSEKLKSYSLLAGSMLATSMAAQAQVYYTDLDPDVELGGFVPSSYPYDSVRAIDFNNDGLFDFKFTLHISDPILGGGYKFRENIDGAAFNGSNAISTYSIEYVPFALKKDCGAMIPQLNYIYGLGYANFAYQNDSVAAYNWNNVQDRYVALKFRVGSDIHYGWVRLDVNTNGDVPNLVIKSYAFENIPDKKIAVCDTGLGIGLHADLMESIHQPTLYPNPSNGTCVIKLEQPLAGEITLSVNDALGKEVYANSLRMSPSQKELPLDLSDLSPGIYFIHLRSETGSITEKWIRK